MLAGMDRYYQIARCMRDEDSRKDRQPEFSQIDIEMSFPEMDDVFSVSESLLKEAFSACGIEINTPFPRLSHSEVMSTYGSDKPDLRYDLKLADVSDVAAETEFRVFHSALEAGGVVKALAAPGWASKSRKEMDDITAEVARLGAKGLGYIKVEEGKPPSGPVAKFLSDELWQQVAQRTAAKPGDAVLFAADVPKIANAVLAWLRQKAAEEAGLVQSGRFVFHWITDFPLFTWNEEEKRWDSEHHPFTGPHPEDMDLLEKEPGKVRSASYDLVINGYECGSGSIRIHSSELQERIFRILSLSEESIRRRFGFFLDALKYGAPPHGGIALGIDRIVAIILGKDSIRDVIAFPKTQKGQDLMSGAPSPVDPAQLKELQIAVEDEGEDG
jgi:aspartyl-tRNA synthetase